MDKKRIILSVINLIAFILTLPGVIALPFIIIGTKETIINLYNQAGIPLPLIVKLLTSIHPLIFVLIILCFIAKEFSKRKLATLLTNITIFFLGATICSLYLLAWFYIITLPLSK